MLRELVGRDRPDVDDPDHLSALQERHAVQGAEPARPDRLAPDEPGLRGGLEEHRPALCGDRPREALPDPQPEPRPDLVLESHRRPRPQVVALAEQDPGGVDRGRGRDEDAEQPPEELAERSALEGRRGDAVERLEGPVAGPAVLLDRRGHRAVDRLVQGGDRLPVGPPGADLGAPARQAVAQERGLEDDLPEVEAPVESIERMPLGGVGRQSRRAVLLEGLDQLDDPLEQVEELRLAELPRRRDLTDEPLPLRQDLARMLPDVLRDPRSGRRAALFPRTHPTPSLPTRSGQAAWLDTSQAYGAGPRNVGRRRPSRSVSPAGPSASSRGGPTGG